MTMTVFELTLAIAIGTFIALFLNQMVGLLIEQRLQREKDEVMQRLFHDLNEGLEVQKIKVKKKNEQNPQKEEKGVDNNPFERYNAYRLIAFFLTPLVESSSLPKRLPAVITPQAFFFYALNHLTNQ